MINNIQNTYQNLCNQISDLQTLVRDLAPQDTSSLLKTDILKRRLIDVYNTLHLYGEYARHISLPEAQDIALAHEDGDEETEERPVVEGVVGIREAEDAKIIESKDETVETVAMAAVEAEPVEGVLIETTINEPLEHTGVTQQESSVLEDQYAALGADKEPPVVPISQTQNTPFVQPNLFSKNEDVNQRFAKQNIKTSVADNLHKGEGDKLHQLIDINDKFFFINELFSGDAEAYQKAVSDIDSCVDRAQAQQMIISLRQRYHWDIDMEAYGLWNALVNKMWS